MTVRELLSYAKSNPDEFNLPAMETFRSVSQPCEVFLSSEDFDLPNFENCRSVSQPIEIASPVSSIVHLDDGLQPSSDDLRMRSQSWSQGACRKSTNKMGKHLLRHPPQYVVSL